MCEDERKDGGGNKDESEDESMDERKDGDENKSEEERKGRDEEESENRG